MIEAQNKMNDRWPECRTSAWWQSAHIVLIFKALGLFLMANHSCLTNTLRIIGKFYILIYQQKSISTSSSVCRQFSPPFPLFYPSLPSNKRAGSSTFTIVSKHNIYRSSFLLWLVFALRISVASLNPHQCSYFSCRPNGENARSHK